MSSGEFSHFYIIGSTPAGRERLRNSRPLQEAMSLFVAAEEAHKVQVPEARLLGAGKFGFTFDIDGTAVKVATPTSSRESFKEKRPVAPEDLAIQYGVLRKLHGHLAGEPEGVTTPEQFFVAQTPDDTFILAQQFMRGWTTLETRTQQIYGLDGSAAARREIQGWSEGMRTRLNCALGGFSLIAYIDDLFTEGGTGIHGGNLLVPGDTELQADTPLCIIDQPTIPYNLEKYPAK